MHKFFAKTLFLGKKVIFLTECHSTNEEMHTLLQKGEVNDGTVLWTDFQSKGRGQRGNYWHSSAGDNLLVSVYLKTPWISLNRQYYLTIFSALAIRNALQQFLKESVMIKWPNDLYVGEKKIAGILCESVISNGSMEATVVGFGINVNQVHFDLDTATSLKLLTRMDYNRETILEKVIESMEKYYWQLKANEFTELKNQYYQNLLWYNQIGTFETDHQFQGTIKGVNDQGNLLIEMEETSKLCSFDIKEIKFLL